jgi:drug/metabolite transporter (DMT)-like permease
MIPMSL